MRSLADFQLVWTLIDRGLNDCAVSRETGIPRPTVREWRLQGRDMVERRRSKAADSDCPACGGVLIPQEPYSYLLGLYLGDGCISTQTRGVYKLRVVLDQRYPGIIQECSEAMSLVRPSRAMRVGFVQSIGCLEVGAFWKHWPCLFPQHGPGRKHERRIKLEPRQLSIVNKYPDRLLRGLIHSDGYRGLNYVNGKGYPRYQFSNRSNDIREIFCHACDLYGVAWRRMNRWNISIARAADVAKVDLVVGPKA